MMLKRFPISIIRFNQFHQCFSPIISNRIRYSHTDIKPPDFTEYIRNNDKKSNGKHQTACGQFIPSLVSATFGAVVLYSMKAEVSRYVKFMDVSADVLAMAQIEINLADIEEDRNITFKWRGKPLFVWHRTEQSINDVRKVSLSILRDPEADADRVQDPKWLIVLGVCTHLGCVPLSHQGDFGGYYCPCHGSHFDISGRARKGPAPTNLAVPKYVITGNILTVG